MYKMYIYENGFAFIHIVKCGGTSVKDTIPQKPIKEYSTPHHKHRHLWEYEDDFKNLTIYANVRNPFERIRSMYFYRHHGGKIPPFEKWFWNQFMEMQRGRNDAPQHCYFMVDGKIPDNVNIIRLEDADKEWPEIIYKWFGVETNLLRSNATHRSNKMDTEFDSMMERAVREKEEWILNNYYKEI